MQRDFNRVAPPTLDQICPLSTLSTNARGIVVEITAGKDAVRRLASLGLTPGAEITVIQNPRYGPLIVLVRNVRLALGRGEAQKIQVRRCE